ncbi:MAG: hypothetical protein IPM83_11790 [Ignavibacteria bacterium]|nr:hypothetical protein [Ignavibacteria bacterium]
MNKTNEVIRDVHFDIPTSLKLIGEFRASQVRDQLNDTRLEYRIYRVVAADDAA